MAELKIEMEFRIDPNKDSSNKIPTDKAIKAIIFDFGGVLVLLDKKAWMAAFETLGISPNFNDTQLKSLISNYGLGNLKSNEFIDNLRQLLKIQNSISEESIIRAWNAFLVGINPELYQLAEFRKNYALFGLSNTNEMHKDFIEKTLYQDYLKKNTDKGLPNDFQDIFIKIYYSQEIRIKKPDPKAWLKIFEEHPELNPMNFLFVDDLEENIQSAIQLGMQVFTFDIAKHSIAHIQQYIQAYNSRLRDTEFQSAFSQHRTNVEMDVDLGIPIHSAAKAKA